MKKAGPKADGEGGKWRTQKRMKEEGGVRIHT